MLTSLFLASENVGTSAFPSRFSLQMALWAVVLIQVLFLLLLKCHQVFIVETWWTQFLSKSQKQHRLRLSFQRKVIIEGSQLMMGLINLTLLIFSMYIFKYTHMYTCVYILIESQHYTLFHEQLFSLSNK